MSERTETTAVLTRADGSFFSIGMDGIPTERLTAALDAGDLWFDGATLGLTQRYTIHRCRQVSILATDR